MQSTSVLTLIKKLLDLPGSLADEMLYEDDSAFTIDLNLEHRCGSKGAEAGNKIMVNDGLTRIMRTSGTNLQSALLAPRHTSLLQNFLSVYVDYYKVVGLWI